MDVISWTVALVAGMALRSLWQAAALGAAVSVSIRAYQYYGTTPQEWGTGFPEDLFGAAAMLVVTAIFAWIGSVIRVRRAPGEVSA